MNLLTSPKAWTSFIFILVVLVGACVLEEPDDDYRVYDLNGFEVRVEIRALEINEERTQEAIDLLEENLQEVTTLSLNDAIMEALQSVVIFVDWNTSNRTALYHPSLTWLQDNGYTEEKYRSVEIPNLTMYLENTRLNHPYIILHELAHAYHHQVLGSSDEFITEAFENARANGLYRDVTYDTGTEVIHAPLSYAYTNEREYFAELTETYFGWNNYFPFIRTELETYDSVGYEMIEIAWEQ